MENTKPKRPKGVSVLSVLFVVGGVLLLGASGMLLAAPAQVNNGLQEIGLSRWLVLAGIVLLACLNLVAGIGMWRGAKWGWWCGAFYCVYAVIRNANALLSVAGIAEEFADELADSARGPSYYYTKFGVRIVVHLLLILYFFRSRVLGYFGMQDINRVKAMATVCGAAIALAAAFVAMSLIST